MNEKNSTRRPNPWWTAAWSAAAIALLAPAVAMQFTDSVDWNAADFAIFGAMIVGVLVSMRLATKRTGNTAYRIGVGLALGAAFLLFWVNGAVGVIGNEDNPANLMFYGVIVVGLIGALLARFESRGMARAMVGAAVSQATAFVVALVAGWGFVGPATLFFLALWLGAARLFQNACRGEASR